MDKDFTAWKMASGELGGFDKNKFSFMTHPYILNPATKAQALYYDNRWEGEGGNNNNINVRGEDATITILRDQVGSGGGVHRFHDPS